MKVSRNEWRITCKGLLDIKYEVQSAPEVTSSLDYTNGKVVPWSGEYLDLTCRDSSGEYIWQDIILRVIAKDGLKGVTKKKAGSLNIAVILLDSMSRAATMYYMPETKKLLKKLWKRTGDHHHRSFVFNRAQIVGPATAQNISPLLCGRSYTGTFADMVSNGWRYTACTQFIWNYLYDLGYVSAYGTIANMFAGQKYFSTDSIEKVGHLTPPYMNFNDADAYISCHTCNDGVVPCCGTLTPAQYQFRYMADFHSDEVYSDAAKFSYIHLANAHSNEAQIQPKNIHLSLALTLTLLGGAHAI